MATQNAYAGDTLEAELEAFRPQLTGYCYRMLGSGFEAEDAVQETMVRAWRGADRLQAHGALKSWLYRIATNVCLDMLQGAQRRARPMDLADATTADAVLDPGLPENVWLLPIPDARVMPSGGDPAEEAALRETIRLAFVAALQHLPPRQRAVLILREVLRWRAAEVAELLDMTVVSVNSALQRARATLDAVDLEPTEGSATVDADKQEMLARYVDCFERYDIDGLVALLHEDATFCMPPFKLWLRGPLEVSRWLLGQGIGCKGSRTIVTSANGSPAFGAYHPDPAGGYEAYAIMVLEVSHGGIAEIHNFLDTRLFEAFGLPTRLEPGARV